MATATDVLAGIKAVLAALYPAVPCRTRKLAPGEELSPLAGWTAADPCPCFVVACPDGEEVDEFASTETISVRYDAVVGYVWPVGAGSAPLDDDPAVRAQRQAIRDALYKPTLAGVGGVWNVSCKSGPVYTEKQAGGVGVACSTLLFGCQVNEPRGFN